MVHNLNEQVEDVEGSKDQDLVDCNCDEPPHLDKEGLDTLDLSSLNNRDLLLQRCQLV